MRHTGRVSGSPHHRPTTGAPRLRRKVLKVIPAVCGIFVQVAELVVCQSEGHPHDVRPQQGGRDFNTLFVHLASAHDGQVRAKCHGQEGEDHGDCTEQHSDGG